MVRFPSAASQKLTEPPSIELVGFVPFADISPINTSSGKRSGAGAPTFFPRGPRRFELRKPPEPRKMRGRLRVTMQREPCHILYFRFDRLE